jgi:hypothetical protein
MSKSDPKAAAIGNDVSGVLGSLHGAVGSFAAGAVHGRKLIARAQALDLSTGPPAVALRRPLVRFPRGPLSEATKKGGALAALFTLFHPCRRDQAAAALGVARLIA